MAVDQIARMMALDAAQSGGGGGGTDNYNDLTNRPKINNVTLTGNKTTSDLGIVENVQADWDETDSTAPSYIQNKPNIPSGVVVDTTYDGTSENAQAGTAVAQAVSTKVDKVTGKGLSENDYTDADKAKLDGIEAGAEANVQADWTQMDNTAEDFIKNKPTIPTVNDAVLTIQKNGTAVGTFSANAATAATINITVPVDAEDVDALPGTTKYGASLALSIDSNTYVVTATLKDQDGNTLGTAQTIDLPLETVVVGGSYDDTTKKVILTLKNGNTIDFSVADLVAGLQTEITSTNKLDADLVDDSTSTNKFVTAADKVAWNAKSDFSGSYNDLTDKPTIPAAVTVDQAYDSTSTNPQSGTAVAEAIGSIPAEVKRIFSQDFALTWGTTESQLYKWFASNIEIEAGKLYLAIITTSGDKSVFLSAILPCNTVGTSVTAGSDFIPIVVGSKSGCTVGKATIILYKGSGVTLIMDLPPAPSGHSINNQSSTLEIYEIQRLLMNDSISADDYASQTIGGTVKAWTTTDGSDTILHLATQ